MTTFSKGLIFVFYPAFIWMWVHGIRSESPVHFGFYFIFIVIFFSTIFEFKQRKESINSLKKRNFADKQEQQQNKELLERLQKGDKHDASVDRIYLHLGFQLFLLISYYVLT